MGVSVWMAFMAILGIAGNVLMAVPNVSMKRPVMNVEQMGMMKMIVNARLDGLTMMEFVQSAEMAVWSVKPLKSAMIVMMEWTVTLAHASLDGLELLRNTGYIVSFIFFLSFSSSFFFAKIENELVGEREE
jgi:hypothetical protein